MLEALRSGRHIDKLFIALNIEEGKQVSEILSRAESTEVTLERLNRRELERISVTKKSQGVIAVVPERSYAAIEDMLIAASETDEPPLLCVLDGIQDPHNLGAIARSVEAVGGHGLVIPDRRAVGITAGVVRASAGAIEHLPVAKVQSVPRTLELLKIMEVQCVRLDASASIDYTDFDLSGPLALVVGAEGEGVSEEVKRRCSSAVAIPQKGKVISLNASVATALVLFEAARQRRVHHNCKE